jgi:hypothetical protein
VFISSRGASISSKSKNGAGLIRHADIINAIAARAFSPPESKLMD